MVKHHPFYSRLAAASLAAILLLSVFASSKQLRTAGESRTLTVSEAGSENKETETSTAGAKVANKDDECTKSEDECGTSEYCCCADDEDEQPHTCEACDRCCEDLDEVNGHCPDDCHCPTPNRNCRRLLFKPDEYWKCMFEVLADFTTREKDSSVIKYAPAIIAYRMIAQQAGEDLKFVSQKAPFFVDETHAVLKKIATKEPISNIVADMQYGAESVSQKLGEDMAEYFMTSEETKESIGEGLRNIARGMKEYSELAKVSLTKVEKTFPAIDRIYKKAAAGVAKRAMLALECLASAEECVQLMLDNMKCRPMTTQIAKSAEKIRKEFKKEGDKLKVLFGRFEKQMKKLVKRMMSVSPREAPGMGGYNTGVDTMQVRERYTDAFTGVEKYYVPEVGVFDSRAWTTNDGTGGLTGNQRPKKGNYNLQNMMSDTNYEGAKDRKKQDTETFDAFKMKMVGDLLMKSIRGELANIGKFMWSEENKCGAFNPITGAPISGNNNLRTGAVCVGIGSSMELAVAVGRTIGFEIGACVPLFQNIEPYKTQFTNNVANLGFPGLNFNMVKFYVNPSGGVTIGTSSGGSRTHSLSVGYNIGTLVGEDADPFGGMDGWGFDMSLSGSIGVAIPGVGIGIGRGASLGLSYGLGGVVKGLKTEWLEWDDMEKKSKGFLDGNLEGISISLDFSVGFDLKDTGAPVGWDASISASLSYGFILGHCCGTKCGWGDAPIHTQKCEFYEADKATDDKNEEKAVAESTSRQTAACDAAPCSGHKWQTDSKPGGEREEEFKTRAKLQRFYFETQEDYECTNLKSYVLSTEYPEERAYDMSSNDCDTYRKQQRKEYVTYKACKANPNGAKCIKYADKNCYGYKGCKTNAKWMK